MDCVLGIRRWRTVLTRHGQCSGVDVNCSNWLGVFRCLASDIYQQAWRGVGASVFQEQRVPADLAGRGRVSVLKAWSV